MSLNLSIARDGLDGQERLFEYALEGWAVTQSLRYRLGESDWWVGPLFDYLEMTTVFTIDRLPDLDPIELDSSLGSLGLAVRYDSRNNTFTPDRGIFGDVEVRRRTETSTSARTTRAASSSRSACMSSTPTPRRSSSTRKT